MGPSQRVAPWSGIESVEAVVRRVGRRLAAEKGLVLVAIDHVHRGRQGRGPAREPGPHRGEIDPHGRVSLRCERRFDRRRRDRAGRRRRCSSCSEPHLAVSVGEARRQHFGEPLGRPRGKPRNREAADFGEGVAARGHEPIEGGRLACSCPILDNSAASIGVLDVEIESGTLVGIRGGKRLEPFTGGGGDAGRRMAAEPAEIGRRGRDGVSRERTHGGLDDPGIGIRKPGRHDRRRRAFEPREPLHREPSRLRTSRVGCRLEGRRVIHRPHVGERCEGGHITGRLGEPTPRERAQAGRRLAAAMQRDGGGPCHGGGFVVG